MRLSFFSVVCLAISAKIAIAAPLLPISTKGLELNAQQGIEWQRDNQQYVAKGGASAKKGDLRLSATEIGATYDDPNSKKPQLKRLYAQGAVRAATSTEQASADSAEYFVAKGYAVLRGKTIMLKTQKQSLIAHDTVEYWASQKLIKASGRAVVTSEGNTLTADSVTIYLKNTAKGKDALTLDRVVAKGNVVITTPQENATADNGEYLEIQGIANLKGNVEIRRKDSVLRGTEAVVNLKSGIATLANKTSVDGKTGRVEGVLKLDELK